MRRSPLFVSLLILALPLIACGENATDPIAASSPRPSASLSRAAAMEGESAASPCPKNRRAWEPPPACAAQGEEDKATSDYYFDVDVQSSRFEPDSFALSLSQQIELANNDNLLHNITIPASGISLDVEVGAEDYTRPITLEPGRYEFFCRIHRGSGMRGFFTMTSNKDVITVRRGY